MRLPYQWLTELVKAPAGVEDIRLFYENDLRFLEQFPL